MDKKRKLGESPLDKSSDVRSREDSSGEAESVPVESPARAGHGVPIRCWYKGKEKSIHDGGGLGSPGRWPVKQRRQLSSESALGLASCCKGEFLKWVLSICNKKGRCGQRSVLVAGRGEGSEVSLLGSHSRGQRVSGQEAGTLG